MNAQGTAPFCCAPVSLLGVEKEFPIGSLEVSPFCLFSEHRLLSVQGLPSQTPQRRVAEMTETVSLL